MGDFIDFAEIQNQVFRREMARIYEFNLMVVGSNGMGKSTLVRSLFRGMIKPTQITRGEPKLNEYTDLLEEKGVSLRLRCVETSGFNYINKDVTNMLVDYIDKQYKDYFKAQRRASPWKIEDPRVHCCLYLIPPYGDMRLRQEDIDCMKALHERVNIVPVIAQADARNENELKELKENILNDLEANKIKYFRFQHDDKEDEERARLVKSYAERLPFAVMATNEPEKIVLDENKIVWRWIRQTMGGPIDIEDNKKCDFEALAKLLIRHCMLDFIDSTHNKHYAKFKVELLESSKLDSNKNLLAMGLANHEVRRLEYDIRSMMKRNVESVY